MNHLGSKPMSLRLRMHRIYQKTEKDENGCLLWFGKRRPDGYGVVHVAKIWTPVHRFVVSAAPGEVVRHKCNVRNCINPEHLIKGTQQENVHDSINAGTHCFWGQRA